MSRYKLLLFDADGTLFDFHAGERNALKNCFDELNLPYDESTHLALYRKINLEIWAAFEQHLIDAADLSVERFRRYLSSLDINTDPADFSARYLGKMATSVETIEGADEVIPALACEFALVMITNGLSSVQHPRFRKSPLGRYFKAIVVSEDVGIAKPHAGIFDFAFKSAGHSDRTSALIVGDNLSSDIRGGIAYGIDTCWFNPQQQTADGIAPTYEISRLKDLISIVHEN